MLGGRSLWGRVDGAFRGEVPDVYSYDASSPFEPFSCGTCKGRWYMGFASRMDSGGSGLFLPTLAIGVSVALLAAYLDHKLSDSGRHTSYCGCFDKELQFRCRECRRWRPACRMDLPTLCVECAVLGLRQY